MLNGIKTNINVDANELNKDLQKSAIDLSEKVMKQNVDSLKKQEEVSKEYLKTNAKIFEAEAIINSKYGSGDIERYKNYTNTTMKESFDIKKENLNDKVQLDIDKKLLGKDSDAEEYRLDRTIAATNKTTKFAKDASEKVQNSTMSAMEMMVKAEEQKALAEIEIRKWKLYKKTFKAFRIINKIFWPSLGLAIGIATAFIVMKIAGFII